MNYMPSNDNNDTPQWFANADPDPIEPYRRNIPAGFSWRRNLNAIDADPRLMTSHPVLQAYHELALELSHIPVPHQNDPQFRTWAKKLPCDQYSEYPWWNTDLYEDPNLEAKANIYDLSLEIWTEHNDPIPMYWLAYEYMIYLCDQANKVDDEVEYDILNSEPTNWSCMLAAWHNLDQMYSYMDQRLIGMNRTYLSQQGHLDLLSLWNTEAGENFLEGLKYTMKIALSALEVYRQIVKLDHYLMDNLRAISEGRVFISGIIFPEINSKTFRKTLQDLFPE